MSLPQADPGPGPRRKARLFCPECGREGALPGEWEVRVAGDRVRTECPDCGTVLDDRPRDPPGSDRSGSDRDRAAPTVVGPAYSAATAGCRWVLATQARLLDRWSDRIERHASTGHGE